MYISSRSNDCTAWRCGSAWMRRKNFKTGFFIRTIWLVKNGFLRGLGHSDPKQLQYFQLCIQHCSIVDTDVRYPYLRSACLLGLFDIFFLSPVCETARLEPDDRSYPVRNNMLPSSKGQTHFTVLRYPICTLKMRTKMLRNKIFFFCDRMWITEGG